MTTNDYIIRVHKDEPDPHLTQGNLSKWHIADYEVYWQMKKIQKSNTKLL